MEPLPVVVAHGATELEIGKLFGKSLKGCEGRNYGART